MALVVPFALGERTDLVTLATNVLILSLLAISFDLCWGLSGIMSFGQALFFGVAGYVIALVGRDLEFSQLWATLPLAMLVGLLLAGLFAAFLLLGRKAPTTIFVALGTLTGSYAAERLVSGWQYVGAGNGLSSVKLLQLGAYEFVEGTAFYFLALIVLVLVYAGARFLKQSQAGLVLAGMRQNEERLAFFGYRVQLFKALVFSLAGMVAGLGGALYSYHQGFIGPGNMGPGLSTTAVIYCLFGGSGTLIGPVLGTVAVEVLTYVLADIDAIKRIWPVILGLVLLAVVMFQPKGFLGLLVSDRERIGSYGRRRPATAAGTDHGAAGDPRRQPSRSAPCGRWRASMSTSQAGTFHGLIGPNGSGKSTLLKAIAGAHFADGGTIVFDGHDITRATPYERARLGLSLKFQITAVLPELSVYDNVLLAIQSGESLMRLLLSSSRRALDGEVTALLERFRLIDRADDLAGELSHGQQQWLEIAMALALRPKLLLLDEPTAGMSPEERRVTGTLAGADQGAVHPDHRRARPAFHPRHLRSPHGARPGPRAGPRRRRDHPALAQGPAGVHHPCLTKPSSTSPASARGYGRSQALFGVSLKVPARGAVAVLGRNGAGKSTLLKALFGELPPMAGTIHLDGAVGRRRARRAARAARHRLRAAGACHLHQAHGAREPAAGLRPPARPLGHGLRARLLPQARPAPAADRRHAVGRRAQDAGDRPRRAGPAAAADARRADRGRLGRRDRGDRRPPEAALAGDGADPGRAAHRARARGREPCLRHGPRACRARRSRRVGPERSAG